MRGNAVRILAAEQRREANVAYGDSRTRRTNVTTELRSTSLVSCGCRHTLLSLRVVAPQLSHADPRSTIEEMHCKNVGNDKD